MDSELQSALERMLANHERIGAGVWVVAAVMVHGPQIGAKRIGEMIGKHPRTVTRELRRLQDTGILELNRTPGSANSYVVRLDK